MADTAALAELQSARKRTKAAIANAAGNLATMKKNCTDTEAQLNGMKATLAELETAITTLGGTLEG